MMNIANCLSRKADSNPGHMCFTNSDIKMEEIKMTTETRGTEKLLDVEDGLCSLTAEELLQVAGGCPTEIDWSKIDIIRPTRFPSFPRGMFPPDLFSANLGNKLSNGF